MGCYDVFCTLCGGPLTLRDILDSPSPRPTHMYWNYNTSLLNDDNTRWLEHVCVIGKWHESSKDADVAVEIYSSEWDGDGGFFEVTASDGKMHTCYVFSKNENDGNYPSYHFVFHTACLTVLERVLEEEDRDLDGFYKALAAQMDKSSPGVGVPLENGHYGAEQSWDQDWEAKRGWEFIIADPVNVPGITEYLLSRLHPLISELESSSIKSTGPPSKPALDTLPTECLVEIRSFLPMRSVFSLRLSCRSLAGRIPLDQRCWREQLLSGKLFGLHDLDETVIHEAQLKNKDWKRLVRTLAQYKNFMGGEDKEWEESGELHDAPIGMKNRMRIRKIAKEICRRNW